MLVIRLPKDSRISHDRIRYGNALDGGSESCNQYHRYACIGLFHAINHTSEPAPTQAHVSTQCRTGTKQRQPRNAARDDESLQQRRPTPFLLPAKNRRHACCTVTRCNRFVTPRSHGGRWSWQLWQEPRRALPITRSAAVCSRRNSAVARCSASKVPRAVVSGCDARDSTGPVSSTISTASINR
jgi:hypothetical protein